MRPTHIPPNSVLHPFSQTLLQYPLQPAQVTEHLTRNYHFAGRSAPPEDKEIVRRLRVDHIARIGFVLMTETHPLRCKEVSEFLEEKAKWIMEELITVTDSVFVFERMQDFCEFGVRTAAPEIVSHMFIRQLRRSRRRIFDLLLRETRRDLGRNEANPHECDLDDTEVYVSQFLQTILKADRN